MSSISQWIIENITLHKYENRRDEFLNGLTHLFGAVLSIVGLILLSVKETETPNLKPAFMVFGLSMILLFTSSTIYHWTSNPLLKRIGRVLDHSNIYILIAGSYTPVAYYLGGQLGVTLIIIEWLCTLLGIVFMLKFWGRLKVLHVVIYLIMGWMLIIVWDDFTEKVPLEFVPTVLSGGIFYSIGVLFYAIKKLPYNHAIWHLFVVLGAYRIFLAIYRYLQ